MTCEGVLSANAWLRQLLSHREFDSYIVARHGLLSQPPIYGVAANHNLRNRARHGDLDESLP
jgi:hypothetical protein